jgi:hypothetical protein
VQMPGDAPAMEHEARRRALRVEWVGATDEHLRTTPPAAVLTEPIGPNPYVAEAQRLASNERALRHVTLRLVIEQMPDALRSWLAWRMGGGPEAEAPIVTVTLPELGVERMPVRPQRWKAVDDGTIEVVFREVRDDE